MICFEHYEQAAFFGQRDHGNGPRAESTGPEYLVDVEPGSAGGLPTAFAPLLAESLSQRGGRAEGSHGLRAAGAPGGPRFRAAGAGRARQFPWLPEGNENLGPGKCAPI